MYLPELIITRVCLTTLFKIKTIFQREVYILDVLACNHSIFDVLVTVYFSIDLVLVTVYFSIGLLQIPDGILKQSRGATPRVGVSKCHRVSVANQLKNITVTHLYHSHAYLIFTLTTFEMDFTCLYRNRYFVLKYEP